MIVRTLIKANEIIDLLKTDHYIVSNVKNKINELIDDFKPNNVVPMKLPKRVRERMTSCKTKSVELLSTALRSVGIDDHEAIKILNQFILLIEETRLYITNCAREEISQANHDKIYGQLVDRIGSKTYKDLDPSDWAETWIMIVELQNLLDNAKISSSSE